MKNKTGTNKDYNLTYNPINIWELERKTLESLLELFDYYSREALELLIRFYYKYTLLDYKKLCYFTDFNVVEFSKMIVYLLVESQYRGTSYISEDGTYIDSNFGVNNNFDFNTRYDFLFLLLKCKYNTKNSNSILNYYLNLTKLDYSKLSSLLNLTNPSWKEIANKMEYDKDGKVESTFNFINDVIL